MKDSSAWTGFMWFRMGTHERLL